MGKFFDKMPIFSRVGCSMFAHSRPLFVTVSNPSKDLGKYNVCLFHSLGADIRLSNYGYVRLMETELKLRNEEVTAFFLTAIPVTAFLSATYVVLYVVFWCRTKYSSTAH